MARPSTRRDVLAAGTGTIAAAIASSASALAQTPEMFPGLDAELLALDEPYRRTLAAMHLASAPHTEAQKRFFAARVEHPRADEQRLRRETGLTVAARAWDQAESANLAIIRRISSTPARSLAGLIFKARISEGEDNADTELLDSITADLVAMGGANA